MMHVIHILTRLIVSISVSSLRPDRVNFLIMARGQTTYHLNCGWMVGVPFQAAVSDSHESPNQGVAQLFNSVIYINVL